MPALWQASERPMYVRTVWVDGVRHAILNRDDPLLRRAPRRPLSSASCATRDPDLALRRFRSSRLSTTGDRLEECFRKLQIVISAKVPARSGDPPVEALDLGDLESESDEELVLKASAQPLCEVDTTRSKRNSLCLEMRPAKATRTAPSDNRDKRYDLSDRVFQWLDLAGRVDLLTPEPVDARLAHPRRSCPGIPHRYFAERPPEKCEPKIETPKFEEGPARFKRGEGIDRPGHAIESSARRSNPSASVAPRPRAKPSGPIVIPKTTVPPSTDANYATRQKVVAEIYDVERQYERLMGRGAADGCGRQIKRQVHIFMPPLPKKSTSATTSRAESLLSHAS